MPTRSDERSEDSGPRSGERTVPESAAVVAARELAEWRKRVWLVCGHDVADVRVERGMVECARCGRLAVWR